MGHEEIVEFLLENGADVNAVASSDVSAMWLAASEGRVEVMKTLLKNNAEASNTRVDGISTLMTAAVSMQSSIIWPSFVLLCQRNPFYLWGSNNFFSRFFFLNP